MHDGNLSISIGASRKETHWKNREILWSELLEKLSKTTRTHETFAEYTKASKARQDEIKDVGGFVGGTLTSGRRKAGNVLERSILSLDADFSNGGLWDTFTLMYDCAACMYSTHKHTPDKNRLRLVIPLSRPVQRDEYEAIGRRVAGAIGIDDFDDTTFEAERLMYWPSTAKDAEFVFEYQDGEWLDPDAVLAEYADWRDSSGWPVSSRVSHVISRELKKAEDPTMKTGIVGTFCRSYSIHEAIEELLSDYYEKCNDDENRYSYKHGSTVGGLVTYEDKWAFSHHGTDPASGKLCNAFDLVRIHLFGLKDEDADPRTNITKLPSFQAMMDYAAKDERVKKQMFKDKMQSALDDFEGEDAEEVDAAEWSERLEYDRKGMLLATPENVRLIIENDPNLKDMFGNDLLSKRIAIFHRPFWRKKEDDDPFWNDTDDAELRLYLSGKRYGIKGKDLIGDVFKSVSAKHAFHPIRDYLNGLIWDGEKRLETLFIDALGIEDSEYSRAVTKAMFVAGVQRVMEPGSYMDYVMVFIGEEGIGKSKLLDRLSRNTRWFVDSCPITGKEAYENIRGKWIVEIAELVGLRKSGTDEAKNFISKRSDFYRAAYDRYPQDQLRQCIFFGSGNDINFLQGIGGDRRFWPCEVNKERKTKDWEEYTEEELDQIWAEAKHYYEAGARPYLSERLEKEARKKQRDHMEIDSWEDDIDAFLAMPVPKNWESIPVTATDFFGSADEENMVLRDSVTIREIWEGAFGERKPIDYTSQNRIKKLMDRKPDWEYKKFRRGLISLRGFVKKYK